MQFPDNDFLLKTKTSKRLYHEYAESMPIIDYHNHLSPQLIATDYSFKNLTEAWLIGDHYKWRAMRWNGVDESYCTGDKPDEEKFIKWAETVPYTIRNPLYHWTHLELKRYFNIDTLLHPGTAKQVYQECSKFLQSRDFSVRSLLRKMKVKLLCTTDDPVDSLEFHQQLKKENGDLKMFPAFRPDAAINVDDSVAFNNYLTRLEAASNVSISGFDDFLTALKQRHDYFHENGCTVSDHGLDMIYSEDFTMKEIEDSFNSIRSGNQLPPNERKKFKSAMIMVFAIWNAEKGWVQQFHLGAMRNNNSRMKRALGADTGWDSIGDYPQGLALSRFLDRLDSQNKLAKTILYNLNPADNEVMATMTGNFNDGTVVGKVQWGSAWWFLDQKDGMIKQLNALSGMGLLSRFVGMLTDSRSFLSFPRHEYFRRILCNLLGEEMEQGELPMDMEWIGKIVRDICFHNANQYFNWNLSVDK